MPPLLPQEGFLATVCSCRWAQCSDNPVVVALGVEAIGGTAQATVQFETYPEGRCRHSMQGVMPQLLGTL